LPYNIAIHQFPGYLIQKNENTFEITEILNDNQILESAGAFEELKQSDADAKEIFEFIENNIKKADAKFADEMIDYVLEFSINELEVFSGKYEDQYVLEKLWQDYAGSTDLDLLKDSKDEIISELAKETLERKYKLVSSEGYIWPIVDYKAYYIYFPYLTDQMKAYIEIMAQESDQPSVSDAAIIISLEEYANRILSLYEFEEKYPGFARIYYIVNMLDGKLWIYMGGIDNTPVFDFNGKILPERLKDFQDNAEKYAGTDFGNKLNEYLLLLESQDYTRTEKVQDYINNLSFY